jgi:hypothetical protein
MIGIYSIRNMLTNIRYIGQSINIEGRIRQHKYKLNRGIHSNIHLQRSYNLNDKYFVYEVLEECSIDNLDRQEQFWIDYYKGYLYNTILEVSREHDYNVIIYNKIPSNILLQIVKRKRLQEKYRHRTITRKIRA